MRSSGWQTINGLSISRRHVLQEIYTKLVVVERSADNHLQLPNTHDKRQAYCVG